LKSAYLHLVDKFHKLAHIDHALTFLQWDQLVMMPPGGNESRANALAELTAMHHELLASDEISDLVQKAKEEGLDPARQRSLLEMEREHRRAGCLPSRLVKAQSLAGSVCEHGWRNQRQDNDWQGFLKNFREVVKLSREEALLRQAVAPEEFETPYDALLDLYCTGDSSSFIGEIFTTLKNDLPVLLQQIQERQADSPSLSGHYSISAQKELCEKLMGILGFDFSSGRLDVSMHPFSTGDRGDQRITTRFRDADFGDALQATAHETGHASYEAGLPLAWDHLPVGRARNLCIHESQSLLFEKQLFLSKPFTAYFVSQIHELLPEARRFSWEQLWQAHIKVQPSLIRIEADEVTYPLHVILRFEIEKDLINNVIEPEDIPDLWHQKMKQYLGLSTTGNYRDGCLQDIHWTDGSFGYFPSYTLGALNSAQFFAKIRSEHPDWQELIAAGEITFIRQWLSKNVWGLGSTMDSQDLVRKATGEGTNPHFFLAHLRERYLLQNY
jgi:carboxypeptidase Taq